jgi:hypothetical protein
VILNGSNSIIKGELKIRSWRKFGKKTHKMTFANAPTNTDPKMKPNQEIASKGSSVVKNLLRGDAFLVKSPNL